MTEGRARPENLSTRAPHKSPHNAVIVARSPPIPTCFRRWGKVPPSQIPERVEFRKFTAGRSEYSAGGEHGRAKFLGNEPGVHDLNARLQLCSSPGLPESLSRRHPESSGKI